MRPRARLSRALATGLLAAAFGCSQPSAPIPGYRELVQTLSEEGGYFDTDNLISNETAYIQVVEALEPTGGVYIGVGPEQNFHYIGRLRPEWAFILDVRRDNMLHHLLLNAVLTKAETPVSYLCRLFSRRCEDGPRTDGIAETVAIFDEALPDEDVYRKNLESIFAHIAERLEHPLDEADRRVIDSIHRSYFDEQLGLRFRSHGRRPMPHHPTYRRLLLSSGPKGEPGHFLSRVDDYRHVRELAVAGRMIPVTGNFAGDHALRNIGEFVEERGEEVTAFYVSNVEFYLIRNGVFPAYVENVRSLPLADSAQFIRAYFSYGYPHPAALKGHRSTLVRQNVKRFLELYDDDAFRNYWDISTMDYER